MDIALLIGCALLILSYSQPVYSSCEPRDTFPKDCDYIIVGAGATGATIAGRLTENPKIKVCLIEAGIRHTEGRFAGALPTPRLWAAHGPGDYTWNTTTTPQIGLNKRALFNGLGKVLGGSTTNNGMAYFRGFEADYNYWADNGAKGWDFKSVLPYFKKLENITIDELRDSPLHSTCGPVTISGSETGFDSPLGRLWKRTARQLRLPMGECNRKSPFGVCVMQSMVKDGKRDSTATAYLDPNIGRPNLFIITEALVGRILISGSGQGKKASGIKYKKHGRMYTAYAKREVILSAGTYESPKLLQISGIGSKTTLRNIKVRPEVILPVGENVMDHVSCLFDLEVNIPSVTLNDLNSPEALGQYLFQGRGLWSQTSFPLNVFLDLKEQRFNWPEMQFQIFDGIFENSSPFNDDLKAGVLPQPKKEYGANTRRGHTMLVYLSHPKSRGTIKAKSSDPEDNPLMDPRYLAEKEDVRMYIKAIRAMQKIFHEAPAMRKLGAQLKVRDPGVFNQESAERCFKNFREDSDEFWECVLRQQANTAVHTVRSCPIGDKKDRWAVVDPELRVYGVRGLRVADASVMPEVSSGNTVAPCIMIGEKAADMILQDYNKSKY